MNKAELVKYMAEDSDLPKAACMSALNSLMKAIEVEVLTNGGEISLAGFGKFSLKETGPRTVINPRKVSEKIDIPAGRSVKFIPFAGLKQKDY